MSLRDLVDGIEMLRARRRAGEPIDQAAIKASMIPFVDALHPIVREPIRGAWRLVFPPAPEDAARTGPPRPRVSSTQHPDAARAPQPPRKKTPRDRKTARDADAPLTYAERLAVETGIFADQVDVHALPPVFHYWSNRYLLPILRDFGCSHPEDFLAQHLFASAQRCGVARPRFVSLGCGNCDAEVRIAQALRRLGLADFTIECIDINPAMLERGRALAQSEGVTACIVPVLGDFNRWAPVGTYDGIMANQSLHHVLELEALFDAVRAALKEDAAFVVSDMIGRNGHQRWPEAAAIVRAFWHELPPTYRYNLQLDRQEDDFLDWDCSVEGFEGVRAQDILPLLLQRFEFEVFVGFGNVIDPFIDRGFGHHFDVSHAFDLHFIDRVQARDDAAMLAGEITPTHMLAVLRRVPVDTLHRAGVSPRRSVRAV